MVRIPSIVCLFLMLKAPHENGGAKDQQEVG